MAGSNVTPFCFYLTFLSSGTHCISEAIPTSVVPHYYKGGEKLTAIQRGAAKMMVISEEERI